MEKIKQPTQIPIELRDSTEFVKVGEIICSSNKFNVQEISKMVKDLLKDSSVKSYLQIIESKKIAGSYVA